MPYYSMRTHSLIRFEKSHKQFKKYNAVLLNNKTGKHIRVPFGDNRYENFIDKTGLNLYPELIHGDKKRRTLYQKRHRRFLKKGYFSPGYFSYYYLW